MIDFLLGVPGKLKTLTDRLSATWAAKLDTLHDSRLTSARAGYLDKLNLSGKATDDAVWTATKAGYLDMAISGVCRIKSIQKVYVTVSISSAAGSATITAVNTAKTIIVSLGYIASTDLDYTEPDGLSHMWTLTNSTTVTLTRGGSSYSGLAHGAAQVIEFY